ncbi:MAG: oligosaccharide flippase family protein, partial [Vicingaceae bacterium]
MIKKGILWEFIGKIFKQGIGFIISIFLARLLSPEEFGLISMVMVIVPITQVFMDMGLGAALIQKKVVSQNLFSSVFWLNIIIGAIMTSLLYYASDYIAQFYQRPELSEIVKILSLIFVISSLGIVQNIHF